MDKLTPTDWNTLVRIFEADGFTKKRQKGSHISMSKTGISRPVVIPQEKDVAVHVIRGNMKTAGMSRKRYFELLKSN